MDNLAEESEDYGGMDAGDVSPPEEKKPFTRGGKPGPGRPAKVKRVVHTRQEFLDDAPGTDDDKPRDDSFGAIFDSDDLQDGACVRVRVTRKDPDEGQLGYLDDPTATVATILEKWGGGVFQCVGLDRRGKVTKGGIKTIKLAGDPIFMSASAEMQWKKAKGIYAASSASTPSQPQLSFTELMAMQQANEDRRRGEEREHQKAMRQIELEAEDKRRKDEDERLRARRLDEEERDARRRKDEDERDTRRKREQVEAEQRQQTFMQQTIQMLQQSSAQALAFVKAENRGDDNGGKNHLMEALQAIAVIKDTFSGDGGDSEKTTAQMLIENLPKMLSGGKDMLTSAIREVRTAPTGAVVPHTASPVAGLLPADSPLGEKIGTLAMKIAAQGKNPEVVLSGVVDGLLAAIDKTEGKPVAQTSPPVPVYPLEKEKPAAPTVKAGMRLKVYRKA